MCFGECAADLGTENLIADAWTRSSASSGRRERGVSFTLDKKIARRFGPRRRLGRRRGGVCAC